MLVAEDNATNQKLVLALLKQRGHEVVVVGNGRQAVEKSAAQPFDVILMDVQMPEMGGLEATAAIRARERDAGGHVPIIALTAHAMAGDRERCLAAGMDAYVSKPLRPQELFPAIDHFLRAPGPAGSGRCHGLGRLKPHRRWIGRRSWRASAERRHSLPTSSACFWRTRRPCSNGCAQPRALATRTRSPRLPTRSRAPRACSHRERRSSAPGAWRRSRAPATCLPIDAACADLENAVSGLTEELRGLIQES